MKAWLLSWNPNIRDWKNYENNVVKSKAGLPYKGNWLCRNSSVRQGDRIYLIKLGNNLPRGIIASGYAASDFYYDYNSIYHGKNKYRVKVVFKTILDYNNEPILLQDELKHSFPDQYWSPQYSGIAIHDQYISDLDIMWNSFINSNR